MSVMGGKVVCFGEMLLRLAAPDRGILLHQPALTAHFGGAEANVAVALARLGHATGMVTRLPANPIGDAALEALRRHGVETAGVSRAAGRMGLYFLSPGAGMRASSVVYDRAGTVFAEARSADFDWPALFRGADWLHLSGITPALGAASAELALDAARAARACGLRISFDGNYRANLWSSWASDPRAILSALVGEADLLIGNHRDIALLLAQPFSGDGVERRREAAEAAFAAFPRLGCIASTARRVETSDRHHLSARVDARDGGWQTEEIEIAGIIDRIGTGDAFAAGVLRALLAGTPDRAAETGLALAALKHFVPGDFSLTGEPDLAAFMAGHRDILR